MTDQFNITYKKANPPEAGNYPGFDPSVRTEGSIIIEQDVAVTLRDGTRIYTDVYRPDGATRVPAIIAWSPYGKRGGFWRYSVFPNNAGVPLDAVSPWAKFEGPDPAYWCRHGYAVINPDARGSWMSEGDLTYLGPLEPFDTYDVIEWTAAQPWSNEKVGMSGNSYLAMSQWRAGAVQPPHLSAIAPWEGMSDIYRDQAMCGGMPENKFMPDYMNHSYGAGRVEDMTAMQRDHPFFDDYWRTKAPDVSKINIPVYAVASWTNPLHVRGTFEAYKELGTTDKWLRVHDSHEWADYHDPANMDDLRRFFDRYLKGEENGWEETPPVRLMLLDSVNKSVGPLIEQRWPIQDARYECLYLNTAAGSLERAPVAGKASTAYRVEDAEAELRFDFPVERDTAVVGNMKLRLWVEADGSDDMDLFVVVGKVDADGVDVGFDAKMMISPGAGGWLRVSHRRLDPERSTPERPYLKHEDEQLLSSGEVVPVEIEIWPWGGIWHAGETIRVRIAPRPISPFTFHGAGRNAGRHIFHSGGEYDSHLLLPFIDRLA